MKATIIDVGGGMRGAFGTGICDYLMDNSLYPFDRAIGVSAGAANLCTYIAGQRGRVLRYYVKYPKRKEYMSLSSLLRTGNYMNLGYIYPELSGPGKEDPFDFSSYAKNPMDMVFVSTDAETGKPAYFPKDSILPADFLPMMASAALPLASKPVSYTGHLYFDGGISDPVPYRKAFELGADKAVLILTKPLSVRRDPAKDRLTSSILSRRYPAAGEDLRRRAETYNKALDEMDSFIKEERLLVISPDTTCGVTTLKHKDEDIMALYRHGYEKAGIIQDFLS